MRTFHETEAALGAPTSLLVLDDWSGGKLAVARWSRQGANVVRSKADALRVVVNLGCESNLHYTQADVDITVPRNTGDIAVVPPGSASTTVVGGTIDVLEIFVETGSLGALGKCYSVAKPLFELANDDLRASAVGLLLAADGRFGGQLRAASATFGQSVLQLLSSRAAGGYDAFRGGLKPTTRRRIDDAIDAWLGAPGALQPNVTELAEAARLSLNQFIRAFREKTGTTPYQYMLARRRRRAMVLLRCPGMSVAEVSDRLGFSSPAHFIASFRQRFGATPGDYRNAILDPALLGPRPPV